MDILVSSNLERMLYLLSDGDDAYVAGLMRQLRDEGRYQVTDKMLARLHEIFSCACCDDAQAAEVMGRVWREHGYVCDPHTAVAWHAADAFMEQADGAPVVVLSTASPYKFPAAVLSALGEEPGDDEFAMMDKLSALTGTPIPKNRPVLHKDVRQDRHGGLRPGGDFEIIVPQCLPALSSKPVRRHASTWEYYSRQVTSVTGSE